MNKGVIRKIETKKGFGFITVKGDHDHFFHADDFIGHWQDLIKDYDNGMDIQVEFTSASTPKGMRAKNVRRLDHPNEAV